MTAAGLIASHLGERWWEGEVDGTAVLSLADRLMEEGTPPARVVNTVFKATLETLRKGHPTLALADQDRLAWGFRGTVHRHLASVTPSLVKLPVEFPALFRGCWTERFPWEALANWLAAWALLETGDDLLIGTADLGDIATQTAAKVVISREVGFLALKATLSRNAQTVGSSQQHRINFGQLENDLATWLRDTRVVILSAVIGR